MTLAQPSILNGGGSAWGRDGLTLSLTDEAQSDWITGPENAFNVGAAIIMRGETTVLDPVLLYSNDTRRVDGFFLNVSRQIAL